MNGVRLPGPGGPDHTPGGEGGERPASTVSHCELAGLTVALQQGNASGRGDSPVACQLDGP